MVLVFYDISLEALVHGFYRKAGSERLNCKILYDNNDDSNHDDNNQNNSDKNKIITVKIPQ